MDLILGTLRLRPYVFGFLAAFAVAGVTDIGWRRTLLFAGWVWPVAWAAEFSSTRTGVPFGFYHYTGSTRGQELYLADVPFMDSLSFTFLAYAALGLARMTVDVRGHARLALAVWAGLLMMLLDVVIDPLAVRGDQWFLGRIFYYPEGGAYFGVPLSNFMGWWIVGTVGIGGYLLLAGDAAGYRPWAGAALYYAVLSFNVAVTAWIGEWRLFTTGLTLHGMLGLALYAMRRTRARSAPFPGGGIGREAERR